MNTLLIDTDVIYYQFAFRNQDDIDWDGDGEITPITQRAKCMAEVDEFIQDLKEQLDGSKVVLVESSRNNFRKLLWPDYKAHRKDKPKPELWQEIKDYLYWGDGKHHLASIDWLEGDDVLGIYATNGAFENPIIVSIDKDMETIPCRLYLWNKPDLGVRTIDPEQAHWNHMYQTLVGDSADGYKGCPGIGAVKATRILNESEDLWASVVETFESKGLTEEDALLQAHMAYILREGDDKYEDGKQYVRLWTPEEPTWMELPDVK